MPSHGQRDRQRANRAKILFWPFVPQAVQALIVQLRGALLAGRFVMLEMDVLTVHTAVLERPACRAVL